MNKLFVICGPTATGKTALALALADKINGELISADSRQIYQGMDIGTGKDLPKNAKFQMINDKSNPNQIQSPNNKKYKIGYYLIRNRPLWLYDIVQPNQTFSAFEYARLARLVIEDITKRGKIPIVVGGAGFYIKALIDGIDSAEIEADWELRGKLRNKDIEELREMLERLNPDKLAAMNNSDRNNARRLIRAIEIAQQVQHSKSEIPNKSNIRNPNKQSLGVCFIGLTATKEILYKQIDTRVEKRVKQGIIEEIMSLLKKSYNWNDPGMNALGYKEWKPFFERIATKQDVITRWKLDERSYAKRQLTWFNKDKRIQWFDIVSVLNTSSS